MGRRERGGLERGGRVKETLGRGEGGKRRVDWLRGKEGEKLNLKGILQITEV